MLGVTPAVIAHGAAYAGPIPPDATLLTGMFLHAGPEHLLSNMIYLWVFGDDIEDALGPFRFLFFYFASGALAALAYVAFNSQSHVPLIGASGAIAGVLAAYLLLRPCARISIFAIMTVVRIRAGVAIGFWALLQILDVINKVDDGVAYIGHVGGLIAGALLFVLLRPRGVELLECVEDEEKMAKAN
jgi:membrane associated rhomboid family serine protease